MKLNIIDEGIKDYNIMLTKQRELFTEMVGKKKQGMPIENEYIFFVEHLPVITLGKHAKESNILFNQEQLADKDVSIYHIERGGDVTYHCPGQIVVYPLLDLEGHHLGVKDYVSLLEEATIRTLSDYGISSGRIAGASGVWIGAGTKYERKICALGVKCSRYITMHGLALNVNADINGFRMINPCGFIDKGVTSMAIELHKEIEINKVKETLAHHFQILLG